MPSEIAGFIVGVIVASFLSFIVWGVYADIRINDTALRALSCMGNGNSIAQCEVVLGLHVPNK